MSEAKISGQNTFKKIIEDLRSLYLGDSRPWVVGFSGGKDSTLVAVLVFEAVLSIPAENRTKEINVVCTDICVNLCPSVVKALRASVVKICQLKPVTSGSFPQDVFPS